MIPELSLITVNSNLEAAYRELFEKKQTYFNDMLESEAEDEIVLPWERQKRQVVWSRFGNFLLKTLIVCLLLGSTLIFSGAVIVNKVASISGVDVAKKIAYTVFWEAENFANAPDDIKELKLERLRQFLNAARPFIREIQTGFSAPPSEKGHNK
jgi:hypothetical protein